MKTTGVRGIPKFGLLDFLGHPNQQPRVGVNDCFQVHDFATHEKEIDDIDFSPDSARLLTVSKDKVRVTTYGSRFQVLLSQRAIVWDVKKGKKHAELGWESPAGVKYVFKVEHLLFSNC